uniref:Uncharacterized protein n=1 Tax=Octopus bimaculoides TaxID=37653 RepID=A0A0L8GXZ0_OCTBM
MLVLFIHVLDSIKKHCRILPSISCNQPHGWLCLSMSLEPAMVNVWNTESGFSHFYLIHSTYTTTSSTIQVNTVPFESFTLYT